jgi:hypothetical protein
VPQDEGDCLLAGQPGERRPYPAAFVEGHDRVGDVRGDGSFAAGGLLPGGAPAAGAEMVQCGVRRGDGQPAHRLAGRHRGTPEGQKDLLSHVLGFVAGAEHPGGDPDDPRIGRAEDRFEIGSDAPSSGESRHGTAVLPSGSPGGPGVAVRGQDRRLQRPTGPGELDIFLHIF